MKIFEKVKALLESIECSVRWIDGGTQRERRLTFGGSERASDGQIETARRRGSNWAASRLAMSGEVPRPFPRFGRRFENEIRNWTCDIVPRTAIGDEIVRACYEAACEWYEPQRSAIIARRIG